MILERQVSLATKKPMSLPDWKRESYSVVIVNASGIATPDGMSIVWLLKLHGHPNVERVYGLAQQWRHLF